MGHCPLAFLSSEKKRQHSSISQFREARDGLKTCHSSFSLSLWLAFDIFKPLSSLLSFLPLHSLLSLSLANINGLILSSLAQSWWFILCPEPQKEVCFHAIFCVLILTPMSKFNAVTLEVHQGTRNTGKGVFEDFCLWNSDYVHSI